MLVRIRSRRTCIPVRFDITLALLFGCCLGLMAQGRGYNNIDAPSANQTYSGGQVFGGWALNTTASVSTVTITIDGAVFVTASYGVDRPDVCSAVGNYPGCPYVGYDYYIDTSQLVNGKHTMVSTAVTTDSQETSRTVVFYTSNGSSSYVDIDNPPTSSESTFSGGVIIGGWTMNSQTTISSVAITIDGASYGNASYGGNRQDACNAVGNFPGCPYVGWSFYLNTAQLANGHHGLTVTSTGSNGHVTRNSSTFNCVNGILATHQTGYNPYGFDEWGSGTEANMAQAAHTQWVRILVPWYTLEPNAPNGNYAQSANGESSGQHTYNWSFIDAQVSDATGRGINIYLNIYWVPPWANGNPYPSCNPVTAATNGQCYVNNVAVGNPQGYLPVSNTGFLQDFAYALAHRYDGLVTYYGPMNEPNLTANFNPQQQQLSNPNGEYLDYYITYLERPVRAGIKAANSANLLVGPDVSLDVCGIPSGCSGTNGWIYPINEYFSSEFDVYSVHTYPSTAGGVLSNMEGVYNVTYGYHPVWLTETGFHVNGNLSNQATQVQDLYVNEYNAGTWWAKTFYHVLWDNSDASGSIALLNQDYSPRPAYYTYQSLYGHQ